MIFTVVNLARRLGIDAEGAMRDANAKFDRRFRYMEAYAVAHGRQLNDMSLDELEDLWQQAKTAACDAHRNGGADPRAHGRARRALRRQPSRRRAHPRPLRRRRDRAADPPRRRRGSLRRLRAGRVQGPGARGRLHRSAWTNHARSARPRARWSSRRTRSSRRARTARRALRSSSSRRFWSSVPAGRAWHRSKGPDEPLGRAPTRPDQATFRAVSEP